MTPPESAAAKLQILATAHWSLLATRSLTYTESLGRVNSEGFLPAPESAHALRAVAQEAAAAREAGEARTILFGLSGHGHFDMSAYDAYFAGKLEAVELSQSRIDAAIEELPRVPAMS